MASDYPNCRYYGCDIVEVANKFVTPRQFTFNIGNVLTGLPYNENTFDFVQIRLLVFALREQEWPVAIQEVLRVTKPGGILQILEPIMEVKTFVGFCFSLIFFFFLDSYPRNSKNHSIDSQ